MPGDPFLEGDSRVLTPEAFEFVLNNELKRAVRSQNYLTLLVVEPTAEGGNAQDTSVMRDVTRVVSREVRETDLLAQTQERQLSVVLLDADLQNSMHVVERLVARFKHYEFATPIAIDMGAACCPTHGADAATLRRVAEAHPIRPSREGRGNASNAQ